MISYMEMQILTQLIYNRPENEKSIAFKKISQAQYFSKEPWSSSLSDQKWVSTKLGFNPFESHLHKLRVLIWWCRIRRILWGKNKKKTKNQTKTKPLKISKKSEEQKEFFSWAKRLTFFSFRFYFTKNSYLHGQQLHKNL